MLLVSIKGMKRSPLTRRTFLQGAGAITAGALVGCGGSDTFTRTAFPVANLAKGDFTTLVGQAVQVTHPTHGTGQIQLDACTDLSTVFVPGPSFRDPFRLAWSGADTVVQEDGVYTFEHPTHGALDMYLFRVGGSSYDVHFN